MKTKYLSLLLTVLIVGIFIWYFATHLNDFRNLLTVEPIYLFLIAIGHFVVLVTNGLFLKAIVLEFGSKMSILDSLRASLVTATGNLVLPAGGGSGVQAVLLKKSHGLSYKNFLSALSGNYIIVFLINSLLGLLALYFLHPVQSVEYLILALVLLTLFVITLWLTIFGVPRSLVDYDTKENSKKTLLTRIIHILLDVVKGWNLIIKSKKLVGLLILITIINFFALVVISQASLVAVGAQITFWGLILYCVLGAISLLVNLTPGSLGIKEAIYIFSSSIIGLTTPQILSAAILDRGIKYLMLIFGWLWVKATGLKYKKDTREISK